MVECLLVTDIARCQLQPLPATYTMLDPANASADLHTWVFYETVKHQQITMLLMTTDPSTRTHTHTGSMQLIVLLTATGRSACMSMPSTLE